MASTGSEDAIAAVLKWGFTAGTLAATTAAAVWSQKRAIDAAVDLDEIRSYHGVLVAKFAPIYEQMEPALTSYGAGMMDAHAETVTRFARWLKQNERRLQALDFEAIDSRYTPIPNVRTYVAEAEEIEMTFNALAYGINQRKAGRAIAIMGVSRFGIAGTGAKISDLSGAARESAILAFLGGGPVPKGGAGMQGGAIALKLWEGIVPTSTLALDGEISRYKSRRDIKKMKIECTEIYQTTIALLRVEERIEELQPQLDSATGVATRALNTLEALEFKPRLHVHEFSRANRLVAEVKTILEIPILELGAEDPFKQSDEDIAPAAP
jgi:hypothetical protein